MRTKAIVMAGGEGTRLRPITEGLPKPMVSLMGAPVLEHILLLLRQSGVEEVCLTLRYAPEQVQQYFQDGSRLGMRLEYRVEQEPLGTAGGVAACLDFVGEEDFFVLSGDCVCDFDLSAALRYHRQKQADATILLCHKPDPTAFGLAGVGPEGRVERFAEKPGWEAVFTDLINAGMYLLSPSVFAGVPRGMPLDFGKDLFPELLRQGRRVYGYEARGYWCDIGTPEAYLRCCQDALAGSIRTIPMPKDGIWAESRIPEGAMLTPPVYIGKDVQLQPGVRLGPGAIIGPGSRISAGARIEASVLSRARVGENASVTGAILCDGASMERGSLAGQGSVLGRGCVLEEGSALLPGGRMWPETRALSGAQIRGSLRHSLASRQPVFRTPGVLQGTFSETLTPELCIRLGAAAAGIDRRVGCAWQGGDAARILADAFACGVCAAGGCAVRPDCSFEAQAAFAAQRYHLPVTVFFRQNGGEPEAMFFGEDGRVLNRQAERALERAAEEPPELTDAAKVGSATELSGVTEGYLSAASRPGACEGFSAAVTGDGAENRALKAALAASGVKLVPAGTAAGSLGILPGGFGLTAQLPDGRQIGPERMLLAAALTELEAGTGHIAVPYTAPAALEDMAAALGGRVLRLGRDGKEAEEMSLRQPFLYDAVFGAVQICCYLTNRGLRLAELVAKTPEYSAFRRVVPLEADRAAVMRALTGYFSESASEIIGGLRIFAGEGRVTLSPLRERSAIAIQAEGKSSRAARELCGDFDRLIRRAAADFRR